MPDLYAYALALLLAIGGLLGVYFKGRSSGEESAEEKQARKEADKAAKIASDKQKVDNLVKEAQRKADAQSIDELRDMLKSDSLRAQDKD